MAEVTFQIDRFEWAGDGRLELAGRWFGLRGHRFLRPTLDVDVDGERRRMLADLEHKPWAADDGADWVAAFTWRGDPAPFDDAELTVSPDLAVQLPAVGGAARANSGKASGTVERRPAGPSRTTVLEGELASAMSEVQRLREQLSAEQTNVRGLDSQLRQARAELAAAPAGGEGARAPGGGGPDGGTRGRWAASRARERPARPRVGAGAGHRERARARGRDRGPRPGPRRAERLDAAGARGGGRQAERVTRAHARARAEAGRANGGDASPRARLRARAGRGARRRAAHHSDRRAGQTNAARARNRGVSTDQARGAPRRPGPAPACGGRASGARRGAAGADLPRALAARPPGRSPEPAPARGRSPRRSSSPGGRSSRRGPPPARRRGRPCCAQAGSRP